MTRNSDREDEDEECSACGGTGYIEQDCAVCGSELKTDCPEFHPREACPFCKGKK
jgi:hypothetical protein